MLFCSCTNFCQALIVARGEKEQLELQLNRLQHKVKDLGEDYRGRLIKYVEDIAVSVPPSLCYVYSTSSMLKNMYGICIKFMCI